MKLKEAKKYKMRSGITLIALVVTIVVLLILAGITINMLFSENGIITKARQAADETKKAEENDIAGMKNVVSDIDKLLNEGNSGAVINPYDPDGWTMAWEYVNGAWSETITAGTAISSDATIVAKLYATGNKVTPAEFEFMRTYTFEEGDEYKMVIEGEGDMPSLAEYSSDSISSITETYAWQSPALDVLMGATVDWVTPYITEMIICDGITKVGDAICAGGSSLKNLKLTKDITEIKKAAFWFCVSLEEVTIPDNVSNIEFGAFACCDSLKNITIPEKVVSIGKEAFEGSDDTSSKLTIAKILTTDENLIVGQYAFDAMAENSVIYVLSENVKTKLEGTYDTTKTTVQVVTKEQMSSL